MLGRVNFPLRYMTTENLNCLDIHLPSKFHWVCPVTTALETQRLIQSQFHLVFQVILKLLKLKVNSIRIDNIVGLYRTNKRLNVSLVENYINDKIPKLPSGHPYKKVECDSLQTEIIPFLKISAPGTTYRIDFNGNITCLKQLTINDLLNNVAFIKNFLTQVPNAFGRSIKPKAPKNVKKRAGTSCVPNRRPNPNTFLGKCKPGYIVLPNKEGAPCCFKIPGMKNGQIQPSKITAVFKRKVINSYARFSMAIPNNLKNTFRLHDELTRLNKYVIPNFSIRKKNGKNTFYIGNRTADRLTRTQLSKILKELQKPNNGGKVQLIARIQSVARNRNLFKKPNTPRTVRLNNKRLAVDLTGNVMKFGGKTCNFYTKEQLMKIARSQGVLVNKSTTKGVICKMIKLKLKIKPNRKISAATKIAAAARGRKIRKQMKQKANLNNNNANIVWRQVPVTKNNARAVLKLAAQGYKHRKHLKKARTAATKIEKAFRAKRNRKAKRDRKAAVAIEAAFRGMRNRKKTSNKRFQNKLNNEIQMELNSMFQNNLRNNIGNNSSNNNAVNRAINRSKQTNNLKNKIHNILPSVQNMPQNNFENFMRSLV